MGIGCDVYPDTWRLVVTCDDYGAVLTKDYWLADGEEQYHRAGMPDIIDGDV